MSMASYGSRKDQKKKTVKEPNMNDKRIRSLKASFDMFDTDKSGEISYNEIYKIMRNIGNPMTKDEIKAMIEKIDASGNGEVDFPEFIQLVDKIQEENDSKKRGDKNLKSKKLDKKTMKEDSYDDEKENEVPVLRSAPPKRKEKEKEKKEKDPFDDFRDEPFEDEIDRVIRAFMHFDKKKKGTISNVQFRHILQDLGYQLSPAYVDLVFSKANLDNNGECKYRDFVEFMRTLDVTELETEEAIEYAKHDKDFYYKKA
ncbi:MAG: EF-hand domain-containing protein [archaeon]|nr:EF-hand domain-containing protein [archaeon]